MEDQLPSETQGNTSHRQLRLNPHRPNRGNARPQRATCWPGFLASEQCRDRPCATNKKQPKNYREDHHGPDKGLGFDKWSSDSQG
jgi:hypothetical protein